MTDQTKTLYKKTFTPEAWDQLDITITGFGYGKTIQDILKEKYDIVVDDPKKTLETNSIRLLEQRKRELLDKGKLEKLRKEVLDLEHKQNNTISKEQMRINKLNVKINTLDDKLNEQQSRLYEKDSEIKRLKRLGNELKNTVRSYCLEIPYRKDYIDSIKF